MKTANSSNGKLKPKSPAPGYFTNVSWHDNMGVELEASTNNNSKTYTERSLNSIKSQNVAATETEDKKPQVIKWKKALFILMTLVIFVVVNAGVILVTINNTNENNNILRKEINQLKQDSKVAQMAVDKLTNDTKNVNSTMDKLKSIMRIIHKFHYVGLGYGRNAKGDLEFVNSTKASSEIECLLFCYKCKKQVNSINGVNIHREDYECQCEGNTDFNNSHQSDEFLHYRLIEDDNGQSQTDKKYASKHKKRNPR